MRFPSPTSSRLRARGVAAAAVAMAIPVAIGVSGLSSPASAAPGNAGVPSDPKVLYHEDFENAGGLVNLPDYQSDSGVSYTADNYWLSTASCNGFIANYQQRPRPTDYCTNENGNYDFEYNNVRYKTYALGLLNSPANPSTNFAVSSNTSPQTNDQLTPPNAIQFATAQQINLPSAKGRFVTFSVDTAATYCVGVAPQLRFYLRDAAGVEHPVSSSAINPCTDDRAQTVTVDGTEVRYGSFAANGSMLIDSTSIGVVMRNESRATQQGNDGAFDNIRILDATPQLDKSFSDPAQTGGVSTLTFTVTNTSDLAAKAGWGFTDQLPDGLTLADSAVGGTCNATSTATSGGSTVSVRDGVLDAGQTSCTVTVQVTADKSGTYTNCPDTNVTVIALDAPQCASVTFTEPSYTVSKSVDATGPVAEGDKVTYSVKVTNTGNWDYNANAPAPYQQASFTDDLSKVLDDATYNGDATEGATVSGNTLTWSGDLAKGETKTITYSVTVNTPDTGDRLLTNAVVPTGSGGSCEQGQCTTTTPVDPTAPTSTPTSPTSTPTSPTSTPTSPTSTPTSPTSTPTSPTSTPTSPTSTTPTSTVTGPPVVTDGPGGGNNGSVLFAGLGVLAAGVLAALAALRLRRE